MSHHHVPPPPPAGPLGYAVVQDVAAPWTSYPGPAVAGPDALARGLILHAAGPTDEGYRTIDIRVSWQCARVHREGGGSPTPAGLAMPPTVRDLVVVHLVTASDDHPEDQHRRDT